jgi:hypothetical protein
MNALFSKNNCANVFIINLLVYDSKSEPPYLTFTLTSILVNNTLINLGL